MIDGVSLNSIRTISRQLDAIDPFNIERIEVLSGASSIYGGNATGGIINIITKAPSKKGISGETEVGVRTGLMEMMIMISVQHNRLQQKERSFSGD
jgi:iron complex outermembrane receptor protein